MKAHIDGFFFFFCSSIQALCREGQKSQNFSQWVPVPHFFPHCFEIHALIFSVCLTYITGMLVPSRSLPTSGLSCPFTTGLLGCLACCLKCWQTCSAFLTQVSWNLLESDFSSLLMEQPVPAASWQTYWSDGKKQPLRKEINDKWQKDVDINIEHDKVETKNMF